MTINIRMISGPPNPAFRKSHNQHCDAVKHATTEQLKRDQAATMRIRAVREVMA